LPARAAVPPVALTENGVVYGTTAGGEDRFLGLRYAQPPVGALRWQPPQRLAPGFGLINGTQFGPHCPQPPSPFGIASTTENCLFLNVYAPPREIAFATRHPRPVMVWIHGGALVTGESDDYDPVRLVSQGGVIVVTINYRLGALGFLAQPALDAEGHAAANYGTLDQQAALAWVRRNIAGFGGDPANVTVFGESAGGLSVLSNLVSPGAAGLFEAAIVESGTYSLTLPALAAAEAQGTALADAVGCTDQAAACLRAVPVATLLAQEALAVTTANSVTPIVDGTVLPLAIGTALASGRFNRVPVMNGSNHDEGRLFAAVDFDLATGAPIPDAEYPAVVATLFGGLQAAVVIVPQYPLAGYGGSAPYAADLATSAITTDAVFACTARAADAALSRYVPTYAYEFNDENAPEDFLPPVSFPSYGATHASEIQFLFNIRERPGTPALTAAEQGLAADMVGYWTAFARTHAPAALGLPSWPRYDGMSDLFQSLVPPAPAPESNFAAEHDCAFWTPATSTASAR
jgi:para-nitrobenzyl esterase